MDEELEGTTAELIVALLTSKIAGFSPAICGEESSLSNICELHGFIEQATVMLDGDPGDTMGVTGLLLALESWLEELSDKIEADLDETWQHGVVMTARKLAI